MELVSLRTVLLLLVTAISSCAGANSDSKLSDPITVDLSRVRFSGGDGSDCNNRILIIGAINEPVGIQAERFWLNKHFPGCKNTHQELFRCDGKPVDWITIQTAEGKTREVVFDVSEFVGK